MQHLKILKVKENEGEKTEVRVRRIGIIKKKNQNNAEEEKNEWSN